MSDDKKCDYMMKVKELSFSYGKNRILNNVSLKIPEGKITTVLGANGCGKSTLFSLMTKNLMPDCGRIFLQRKNIGGMPLGEFAKRVSIVHQYNTAADDMTVERLVSMGRTPHRKIFGSTSDEDENLVNRALEVTNLLEFREREIGKLSGGQRQALTLLMATLQKPKLLLLDEHTAALDPKTAAKVLEITEMIVNRDHLTTMMITHNMQDAITHGNRLIMMMEGKIILDIQGEEKKKLTVRNLLDQFEKASGQEFSNDSALLS